MFIDLKNYNRVKGMSKLFLKIIIVRNAIIYVLPETLKQQ